MPRNYYGSSLSLRFAGALVVFAVAALSGAVIGGVSVYIINDALTPPPSAVANANRTSAGAERPAAPSRQAASGSATGAWNGPSNTQAVSQDGVQQGRPVPQDRPVRIVDPAFPPPSTAPTIPATSPAQMQPSPSQSAADTPPRSSAASQPAGSNDPTAAETSPRTAPVAATAKPWPDALSRTRPSAPSAPAAEKPQQNTTARGEERVSEPPTKTSDDRKAASSAHAEPDDQKALSSARAVTDEQKSATSARTAADDQTGTTRKAASAKRRATSTKRPTTEASDEAQSGTRRSFYDYYDRDERDPRDAANSSKVTVRPQPNSQDPRLRRSAAKSKERIVVRQQRDPDEREDRSDDSDRAALPAQPRPAQSFFGFFGGDHDDHWHDDDDRD